MDDNVKGFPGYHITKDGKLFRNGKLVKMFFHHNYMRCVLHNGKKYKNAKAHRLVAEAYIPNPGNLPLVRHLDDNPLNNHISNLAWGTKSDNTFDGIRNGKIHLIGKDNPMYGKAGNLKFSCRKARRFCRLFNKGLDKTHISNRLNVSVVTLSNWVKRGLVNVSVNDFKNRRLHSGLQKLYKRSLSM